MVSPAPFVHPGARQPKRHHMHAYTHLCTPMHSYTRPFFGQHTIAYDIHAPTFGVMWSDIMRKSSALSAPKLAPAQTQPHALQHAENNFAG